MKLRIQGNSLRLRITPSEMARLLENGRIEETIYFAAEESSRLIYALVHRAEEKGISVRYAPGELAVVISSDHARGWAQSQEVGLYERMRTSHGTLDLAIEKDFACLDKNEAENVDTFPNPKQGSIC